MSILQGSRLNAKERAKEARAAAKRLELQKAKELSGGRSAQNLTATISNIKLTTQKYLSKYENDYLLLRTEEEVKAYFDDIIEAGIAAIDTETTGLDTMRCKLAGLCLYIKGKKPCYIPVNHIGYISRNKLPDQLSESFLKEQLERCEDVKWIFHNAKYDIRVLRHTCGVYLKPYWDTMIAARLLNENESAALKNLHLKYCDSKDEKALTISNLFDGLTFTLIPVECAYLYAAGDAIKTYDLYEFQKRNFEREKLARVYNVFKTIEMPLITVLADMEDKGVYVDKEYAKKLQEKYHKLLKEAEDDCMACVQEYDKQIREYMDLTPDHKLSYPLSISSPLQVGIFMYDILHVLVSKDGSRKTGEEILSQCDHPFAEKLLKYREINKLITTYVDKLPNVVDERDGRIHPTFNQYGAACVTPDTVIITDDGYYTMDELVDNYTNGEFVEFHGAVVNEDNQLEHANGAIMYENKPVKRITTDYGFELTGTFNHPIRVSGDDEEFIWKKLEDVDVGDEVIIPNYARNRRANDFEYIPTHFTHSGINKNNPKSPKLPEYWDENFAEFLGIVHHNGKIVNGRHFCKFMFETTKVDLRNRIYELANILFNLEPKEKPTKDGKGFKLEFRSKILKPLTEIIHKRPYNRTIPREIWRSKTSVINAYIKGLALTANVRNRRISGDIIFKMDVSDNMDTTMIQMHLMSQGILTLRRKRRRNHPYGTLTAENWNVVRFFDEIGFIEQYKTRHIENYRERVERPENLSFYKFEVVSTETTWIRRDHKKEFIEPLMSNVYDIHVPGTHSFVSNGIISHNTGRLSSQDPKLGDWGQKIRLIQGRAVA